MATIWKVTINNEEPVWMVSLLKPTGEELSRRFDIIQDYFNSYEGDKKTLEVKTFKGLVAFAGEKGSWLERVIGTTFVQVAPESFLGGVSGDFRPNNPVTLRLEKPLNLSIYVSKATSTQSVKDLVLSLDE